MDPGGEKTGVFPRDSHGPMDWMKSSQDRSLFAGLGFENSTESPGDTQEAEFSLRRFLGDVGRNLAWILEVMKPAVLG